LSKKSKEINFWYEFDNTFNSDLHADKDLIEAAGEIITKTNTKDGNKNKKNIKKIEPVAKILGTLLHKNYEMIQGAQLSNSFIILMALEVSKGEPLNITEISEIIAVRTKGQVYKISATLKDALEYRLKREGYVEGIEVKNKSICTQLQKKVRNYYRDGFLF
jgi:hypothetical protein